MFSSPPQQILPADQKHQPLTVDVRTSIVLDGDAVAFPERHQGRKRIRFVARLAVAHNAPQPYAFFDQLRNEYGALVAGGQYRRLDSFVTGSHVHAPS
jgi:hypothetical protein